MNHHTRGDLPRRSTFGVLVYKSLGAPGRNRTSSIPGLQPGALPVSYRCGITVLRIDGSESWYPSPDSNRDAIGTSSEPAEYTVPLEGQTPSHRSYLENLISPPHSSLAKILVPGGGIEPPTSELSALCSAIELPREMVERPGHDPGTVGLQPSMMPTFTTAPC